MQPCAASKNSRAARSVSRSACSGSRTFRSWTPSPSRNLRAASSRSIGTIRGYQHRLGPCQRQEGTGHISYPIFLDARTEIGNDAWLSRLCKKHGATHLSPHGVSGPNGCSRFEYASCPNPIALTKEIERSCVRAGRGHRREAGTHAVTAVAVLHIYDSVCLTDRRGQLTEGR